jgi:hypothetical protein
MVLRERLIDLFRVHCARTQRPATPRLCFFSCWRGRRHGTSRSQSSRRWAATRARSSSACSWRRPQRALQTRA